MADELEFYGNPSSDSGLTVIARVYDSAGAQVSTDVTCAEVGVLAIYQGDMPTAVAGTYGVRFFNGTTLLGQGCINWDGTNEVTEVTLNTAISGIGGGTAPTEADIYTYFTSLSRQDTFKADVTALATQSSVDVIDTNVDAILVDTSDLQTNQGNWLTATGFSTFDPASDAVANVTLVDTTTTNTDMRGTDSANTTAPDNASITAILADTSELQANQGDWVTATSVDLNNNAITSSVVATNALNNSAFTTGYYNSINAEVDTALTDYDSPTKAELDTAEANIIAAMPTPDEMTAAELHIALDSYTNKDDFKADVSSLSTQASVDVVDTVVDAIKVKTDTLVNTDLTGIALTSDVTSLNDITAGDVVTAMQAVASDFQADVSSLETKAQADARQAILISEHDATQASVGGGSYDDTILIGKIDVIDSNLDAVKAKTDTLVNTDLTAVALESTAQSIKKNTNLIPASV